MFTSPLPQYEHQARAHAALAARPTFPFSEDVFAWLMEMGTGKTKVVLDEWQDRVGRGELHDLVVSAPAGSYRNWFADAPGAPSQVATHLDPALRKDLRVGFWRSGAGVTHQAELRSLLNYRGPRMLFINTEALSGVRGVMDLCRQFMSVPSRGVQLVQDESTFIKSPDSIRSQSMRLLAELASSRRIMTGLVTPQSPLDLFAQFEFLDWRILGHQSFYTFRARYAVIVKQQVMAVRVVNGRPERAPRRVEMVVGYRNVEELQAKIAPYSYRCLKSDCLDLPPKVYEVREVELTKEQARMYAELRRYATAELDSGGWVTAPEVMVRLVRMHQLVCGYVVDEQGQERDIEENRTRALTELLREHSGKAVVWVAYDRVLRRTVAALQKEFGEQSTVAFWGGNRDTRGEGEVRFKTDPGCRFMVATPAAGGLGNNWQVANLEVYLANTYNLEHRLQSEDRLHRGGQVSSVTLVDLVARGTVDEKIIQALRSKLDLSTTINGDNYREWLI